MKIINLLVFLAPTVFLGACANLSSSHHVATDTAAAHAEELDQHTNEIDANLTMGYEDIWMRIIDNYQLDLDINNPRIEAHRNWYKKHQAYLDRVAERGERYLHFITEQIESRQIPGELALLPIVESAFDPYAYSHGRAAGVWQFIPSTGQHFGLQRDFWHDGRRDIRASTDAALTYLEALNREFKGDWLLALAAYNSGAGTVRKAIRNNTRAGKATDFWSLDLPRETRDYVPKLVALAQLVKDADHYGVTLQSIPNEPYFAVAQTGGQIDLSLIAELAQTPLDEIYKLNPSYNKWATHPSGPHEVLIPAQQLEVFEEGIANLPDDARIKWQHYQVKSGDTLIAIARKFHTTVETISQTNNINGKLLSIGQDLLIPIASQPLEHYTQSESQRTTRLIAARQPANTQRIDYTIKNGDSLWGIATAHGVSMRSLASWNAMAPRDPIRAGQTLVIWTNKSANLPAQRTVIRPVGYTVRSGDSLAGIAQRFNVSLSDIKRWNPQQAGNKYLRPGQKLTLQVDVMR